MKKMQLSEMVLSAMFFGSVLILGLAYSGWLSVKGLKILILILVFFSILVPFGILCYARTYSKDVFYNFLIHMVEIHIGRSITPMKLATTISRSIRFAKEHGVGVLFYTNHITEVRLREKFGSDILIKKANVFQKVFFYIPFYIMTFGKKKNKKYPLLRCEIYPTQVLKKLD